MGNKLLITTMITKFGSNFKNNVFFFLNDKNSVESKYILKITGETIFQN